MGALSREDRSIEHGLVSEGLGSFQPGAPPPRCLSGLSSILADAVARIQAPAPAALPAGRRQRLKLWELDRAWHCALLGVSLGGADLRAVAAKSATLKSKAREASDFELHVAALRFVCRDRDLGKALTKALDRKHARIVAQLAKIDDPDQLLAQWSELVAQGDLAGAYWALMSHPAVSDELRLAIAGDVHMQLYHGVAANRAELRRSQALERDKAELEARAARKQAQAQGDLARKDAEIDELRRRLERQPAAARPDHDAEAARWRDQAATLGRQLEAGEEAARQAQVELRELKARLERLDAQNAELRSDNEALSRAAEEPWGDEPATPEAADLDGRHILFVGGRTQHIPHYRRLVERRNGVFIHHDGGVDDSIARLRGLFGRADAVLFPVDCVSHMAQDEVKKLCRRWDKPFVPVRRSGFAAFLVALETVATVAAG